MAEGMGWGRYPARLGSRWIPRCFLFSLPFAQTTALPDHVVRWSHGQIRGQEMESRPFQGSGYKCVEGFTQPFLGPAFLARHPQGSHSAHGT